ncbi:hypothetical protein G7Y89_g11091 [Cudoniella acicularis]|uniref:6-methylsalicylate decarboxylase n=1 Tax=Cudoniella acicularis TaxID=354080 RepID=A0A8H4REB1_9HELO|nr:hypothetical protein G7Y89_g11091 [Cudoniella acicularis]
MTYPGWLDVHGHFSPPKTPEEKEKTWHAMREAKFMAPEPFSWEFEEVLKYNDKAGIAMQMLSNIPPELSALKASNDFGISIVQKYPSRFGLLVALPTNNTKACIEEIERTSAFSPPPDGFAVTTTYAGIWLSDASLEPVWKVLNECRAVVHVHPDGYAGPAQGRPSPLIEVAFDTARTAVDMLYNGMFRRYPHIKFIFAHCGGALPVLSGRIALLGAEAWVPNPEKITKEEIKSQLGRLYVDTAASAETGLAPALKMAGMHGCIYGADCGVPCSREATMEENRKSVLKIEREHGIEAGTIGNGGYDLFPSAAKRAKGEKL